MTSLQIGLVEQEWLATLATINAEEVTFTDYVNKGRELAKSLKNEVSLIKIQVSLVGIIPNGHDGLKNASNLNIF